jgi:hypothetical protein
MYNMDISILGYKLNLEVLILIGIIYLILVGHTFCGCCNMGGLKEGLTTAPVGALQKQAVKQKMNSRMSSTKEGFTGANTNYGESSLYSLTNDNPVNTASWMAPNMSVVPGQPLSAGVKAILNRKPQPVPLPEGEMLLFANTPFKPECCPNAFSTSTGCACMTTEQFNYLTLRGGNNTPYSEY